MGLVRAALPCLVLVLAFGTEAADVRTTAEDHDHHVGRDLLEVGRHTGVGFVAQFTSVEGWLMLAALADLTFLLSLNEVQAQQGIEDAAVIGPVGQKAGDVAGLVLNFGLAPIGAYTYGRLADDDKATHFATELAATQLIASVETFAVSQIPFHRRPVVERGEVAEGGGGFFNDFFRGKSSYPSGHLIGSATLMFKGWEWYGWKLGLPATAATVFIGWARIAEGQHYLTDIVGSVGIAGIAAYATSRARGVWGRLAIEGTERSPRAMLWPVLTGDAGQIVVVGQF